MARKQHLINVHTSTNTTAPTGASLYLGEIAVQHTPNEPALWIKMGSAQTSDDYEKFIGETEIMTLIEDSKILGSGYTYSGLSYVNSATTIADAYSALTNEMILNEKVGAAALNELNRRVNELSGNTSNVEELINEDEEIIAGALNTLSNRIGTVETQMTGDYIPITGYELASGTSEEELALSEEDTVNEAFGKLQKQMLDNEEAVAAGFNYFRNRFDDIEEEISHSTGVTALSGAVVNVSNKLQALSAVTEELSATTQEAFGYIFNDALPGLENDLQALSASVESISAKTSGVLTLSLNGVEQGKYSPSANTAIDLEVIQEVTGDDVLLTGYELATGSTEADLAIVATDTVNEAFGKLQKQNYDNEAVVAGALNDIDERINELSGNTGGLTGASLNSTPLAVSNQVVTIPVTVSGSGIASASVSGSIADAKAVKEYVEDLVSSSVDYKGATGSTPASAVKGDLYIASADFLIGSDKVETGDFIIYNGTGWDIIEKNLDGAITGALTANTVTLGDSANSIKSLANGTAGQVLTMGSSAPEWSNLPVLSSATTGTGNVVTSILVNGHEITYAKDFTAAANADLTSLSASVVDNENNISALSASVIGNKNDISAVTIDLDVLSGAVESIDYVVAQSLNSLNDRIAEIEGDSGLTALSASVVTNETDIVALSASVIDNEEAISAFTVSLIEFSGAMEDTEYVVAQTFNSVNSRLSALEGNSGLTALSASVVSNISNVTALSASVVGDANKVVGLSASVVTNESNISALSASVVDNKEAISALTIDLDVLSAKVEDDEYVIAQAFNTFNDRINAIEGDSGLTALSASVVDNKNDITALSAAAIDNKEAISAVTGDLNVLSGAVESIDYVVAQSLNNLNDRALPTVSASDEGKILIVSGGTWTMVPLSSLLS